MKTPRWFTRLYMTFNPQIPTSKAMKNECREKGCSNSRQNGSSRCIEHKLGPQPVFNDEAVNLTAGNPQQWS